MRARPCEICDSSGLLTVASVSIWRLSAIFHTDGSFSFLFVSLLKDLTSGVPGASVLGAYSGPERPRQGPQDSELSAGWVTWTWLVSDDTPGEGLEVWRLTDVNSSRRSSVRG